MNIINFPLAYSLVSPVRHRAGAQSSAPQPAKPEASAIGGERQGDESSPSSPHFAKTLMTGFLRARGGGSVLLSPSLPLSLSTIASGLRHKSLEGPVREWYGSALWSEQHMGSARETRKKGGGKIAQGS